MEKYQTFNSSQTKKLGQNLAKKILKLPQKKGALLIGLVGDLGAGKTTFLQGFAKGVGIKEKILSPTFVIMKKFQIQNPKSNIQYLIHIDCYRIQKPEEILEIGFQEIISNPENIIAIEWSEKIEKILPKNIIKIKFKFINKNTRKITVFDVR
ncbi:tRNA (adenosine(37)-N6)-threonylcarbamoyltransferase complex ATPase subunit type 1 TsaE [Candidatus Parcubacteria bacterium]|nr:tRNA (adenosine(37)-N6)-threonylcarbamoyltransferase complex ATPase subunit type 1 TsaE [Candidatus Parcubacteria bacterium]